MTHSSAATRSNGQLEAVLHAGHFALTAETSPPDSTDPAKVVDRVACLKGLADAVNVTDGAGARSHMSAFAAAAIMAREGIDPVLQFTCRDRNRLAIQGDLIGAAALGIHNILCLHGDDMKNGDQPDAKMVYDIDSRGLLSMTRDMRDKGELPSGRAIDPPPKLFAGAADMPRELDADWKPDGLIGKIEAGADFFQTQYCFDMGTARRYFGRLKEEGITDRAPFLVGLAPFASAKSATWMNDNLFGVNVPDEMIKRLEGAGDQKAEGRKICLELLEELQEIDGVAGAHLMAPRAEASIAQVIEDSGIRAARGSDA